MTKKSDAPKKEKEVSDLVLAEHIAAQSNILIRIQNAAIAEQIKMDALIAELNRRKALLKAEEE